MRVGTSFRDCKADDFCEDHPHACGDKMLDNYVTVEGKGSSPCVWGQAEGLTAGVFTVRIIPMRVGTSFFFHTLNVKD